MKNIDIVEPTAINHANALLVTNQMERIASRVPMSRSSAEALRLRAVAIRRVYGVTFQQLEESDMQISG